MHKRFLICGFGRCGTSVTMQMLDVAGLRMPGKGPFFEAKNEKTVSTIEDWDVAKWLGTTQTWTPPEGYDYHCLWLRRNPYQQALSRVKFMKEMKKAEGTVQQVRKRITAKTAPALSVAAEFTKHDIPIWDFEDILEYPYGYAEFLCTWVGVDLSSNYQKMAKLVKKRSAVNYKGFLEEDIRREVYGA